MKKILCSLGVCCLLAMPVFSKAQQTTAADTPDKADVVKFLDLMHARSQMTQMLDGMAKQMKVGAEDGFKQKVPDATPEQLAKLDKFCDALVAPCPIDILIRASVPAHQQRWTEADLGAVAPVYAPAGRDKSLRE